MDIDIKKAIRMSLAITGLQVQEAAKRAGIERANLSKVKSGETIPSIVLVMKIASGFGMGTLEFLEHGKV